MNMEDSPNSQPEQCPPGAADGGESSSLIQINTGGYGNIQASGADRGTAYHTFMENLNFSKKEELRFQLEELISCGKMSEEAAAMILLFCAPDSERG